MSRTAPVKRPALEGLIYQAKKKQRVLSEIETRVDAFRKIICSKGSESSEVGQALFTWIASNPADEGIWQGVFSALGLSTEKLEFQTGDSVNLPSCLWNVHGTYFQTLFNKKMKETPLKENAEDIVLLEAFKTCLKTCSSASILDQTNWQGLFMLAQKYQVLWLINECENFLCKNKNLFQFSETDQQMLLCFAAQYNLSKLLRTCLHHFIRYDVKTAPDLLKQIQEAAQQFPLADLKLYASSLLNDSLWIDPLTDELCLELDSEDVETNLEEIRECISSNSLWHSPQIRLSIDPQTEVGAATLKFLLEGNRTLTGLSLFVDSKKLQPITEMMQGNRSVKHLALHSEKLESLGDFDAALAFFLNFLKEQAILKTLSLWNCQLGTQSGPALQAFLSFNPHLESLTIADNYLGKEMLLALQKGCAVNTKLTELSIEDCDICGEGSLADFLTSLESHPTLKKLKMGQPYNIDQLDDDPMPMLLALMKKNKTLESVSLTSLVDESVEDILIAMVNQECSLKEIIFRQSNINGGAPIRNIFELVKELNPIKRIIFQDSMLDQAATNQLQIEQERNPLCSITFLDNIEMGALEELDGVEVDELEENDPELEL